MEFLNWKIVKKTHTPSDSLIDNVKSILFPPLESHEETHDGKSFRFCVDRSIDANLEAALEDLRDGNNDAVTQKTIRSTINKLVKVRDLLEAYSKMDENAEYVLVEDDDRFGVPKAEDIEVEDA